MYFEKPSHKIYYKDSGDNSKPAVIFIHGFPLDHTMWDNCIHEVQKRYRTITYDIRGLGKSTMPRHAFTFEFYIDDLLDLMNHLSLDQAILCGLSMGGYIALRAAERKPEKFTALVLCDTQARPDHNAALLGRHQNIRILTEQGIDVFTEKFVNSLLSQYTLQNNVQVADHFRNTVKSQDMNGIAATLAAIATRTSTVDFLNHIQIPVLFVCGEYDSLTPSTVMQEMAEMVKGSILKIIPGTGHMSPMENPGEFARLLADFLP